MPLLVLSETIFTCLKQLKRGVIQPMKRSLSQRNELTAASVPKRRAPVVPLSRVTSLLERARLELVEQASKPVNSLEGRIAAARIRRIMHEQRRLWLPRVMARIANRNQA